MSDKVSNGFQWVENGETGDPTGVRRNRDGTVFSIFAGTAAEVAAAHSLVSGVGKNHTLVCVGDSFHGQSLSQIFVNASGGVINSYNSVTGVLSIGKTGHGFATGRNIGLAVQGQKQYNTYSTTVTALDANNFTCVIPTGCGAAPAAANTLYWSNGQWGATGIIGKVQAATGGRLDVMRVAGITGETTAQIMDRIDTEVLALYPSCILMNFGTNDATGANCPNSTAAAAYAVTIFNIAKPKVLACAQTGALVLVETLTPMLSGYAGNTVAVRVFIAELNRLIKTLPVLYPGVAVVDSYAAIVNTSGAITGTTGAGSALANYVQSDGIHRTPKATAAIAPLYAAVINSWFPALSRLPMSDVDCYDATINPSAKNKFANATCLTVTGGTVNAPVTGTAANNWSVQMGGAGGTCVASVAATGVTGGLGNAQVLTTTVSGAGLTTTISGKTMHTLFSPGDKVKLRVNWKTTGFAATGFIRYIALFVAATVDGNSVSLGVYDSTSLSAAEVAQVNVDGYAEGATFPIPAGASLTALTWSMVIFTSADVASSCTQQVGQACFELVTY